jgi:hypothetical protein
MSTQSTHKAASLLSSLLSFSSLSLSLLSLSVSLRSSFFERRTRPLCLAFLIVKETFVDVFLLLSFAAACIPYREMKKTKKRGSGGSRGGLEDTL